MSENNKCKDDSDNSDLDIINYRNKDYGNTMGNYNKLMNSENFSQNVCKLEVLDENNKNMLQDFCVIFNQKK